MLPGAKTFSAGKREGGGVVDHVTQNEKIPNLEKLEGVQKVTNPSPKESRVKSRDREKSDDQIPATIRESRGRESRRGGGAQCAPRDLAGGVTMNMPAAGDNGSSRS